MARSARPTGSTCGPGWPGSPAARTPRSRSRGVPGGGMSPRSWPRPASRRTWPSRHTAFARGRKRHAKTDKTDCRHLRQLLAEGRLPECWIPPGRILDAGRCSSCITTCGRAHGLGAADPRGAVPPGAPALGEARCAPGRACRAAGRLSRSPVAGLAAAGRHRAGGARGAGGPAARGAAPAAARGPAPACAKVLAARLYGVGPFAALAMTCCWAGQAVLLLPQGGPFAGWTSPSGPPTARPARRLSRQDRRAAPALYQPARPTPAPRPPTTPTTPRSKTAATQARRPVRSPQDPPPGLPHPAELGDDALTAT